MRRANQEGIPHYFAVFSSLHWGMLWLLQIQTDRYIFFSFFLFFSFFFFLLLPSSSSFYFLLPTSSYTMEGRNTTDDDPMANVDPRTSLPRDQIEDLAALCNSLGGLERISPDSTETKYVKGMECIGK